MSKAKAKNFLASKLITNLGVPTEAERDRIHCLSETGGICMEQVADWKIYRGDLSIPSDLLMDFPLIVDGNLEVLGTCAESNRAHLVCLGNLKVKNIYTTDIFLVKGDVEAEGFIYASGNDYVMEIHGIVRARWVSISERCSYPSKLRFEGVEVLDLDIGYFGDPGSILNLDLMSYFDEDADQLDDIDHKEVRERREDGETIYAIARNSEKLLKFAAQDRVFTKPRPAQPVTDFKILPWW
ncbi:hypothetical protein GCM10007907_18260 [Chitinimonas prasina]|uniref:Polymer-forming cytoskeletal protein n=1 Tax=Chitinimonas prasina TaxID=1434937 RepID=A0ABQ5YID9_9NEIS|nr:hypothetical protein [Chitinimonas prasina]GLR13036.1 hypothetical protein GCM10007907_18260 [Chitinimonas prasina]